MYCSLGDSVAGDQYSHTHKHHLGGLDRTRHVPWAHSPLVNGTSSRGRTQAADCTSSECLRTTHSLAADAVLIGDPCHSQLTSERCSPRPVRLPHSAGRGCRRISRLSNYDLHPISHNLIMHNRLGGACESGQAVVMGSSPAAAGPVVEPSKVYLSRYRRDTLAVIASGPDKLRSAVPLPRACGGADEVGASGRHPRPCVGVPTVGTPYAPRYTGALALAASAHVGPA